MKNQNKTRQQLMAENEELRRRLAVRVFARTSAYDATIAGHLAKEFGTPAPGVPEPAASR